MRRVLLDQGLAPATAVLLRGEGWDAIHVAEVGLDRVEDSEILEFARRDDRVCVTLDHDFTRSSCVDKIGRPFGYLCSTARVGIEPASGPDPKSVDGVFGRDFGWRGDRSMK
jgi:predicted nuclease of predicted toxin-antitoxin system